MPALPAGALPLDEPGGAQRMLQSSRDVAVQSFREEGTGIDALASQFGISRRSVFRTLARGRKQR